MLHPEKQGYGYFPDDCWELKFQKLREDDERDLDSISLVSKRSTESPSIRFRCSTEPPRDGFRALELNKNIKNYLKVLDCSGLCSMQDKDLVLIADLFPRIEELRLRTDAYICNDAVARITDDGIDALATKLKELKEIEFTGYAWFITDQSLISLSTNCVKLRKISLYISSRIVVVTTFFILFCNWEALANAKNLHSLTMTQELILDKHICLVANECTPLRKLKLVDFSGQYPEIHAGLKFLLQACELTLEELTLINWALCGPLGISDLAQYLSNLTSIDLDRRFGLTSVTFYTLSKSCPLLEILMMARTREHLDISCG
ncbi:hypothetical protein RHSIM_Rhsim01G0031700 [Rhododendron simsii]|uniref:RNI-like superfamily protein n=1 Tax=Rhododendron simsii TaxID=118357 RepID=A0A834HLY7_RHOSS|nr:hypothetical protein RHSIM_Rhsim01G0031700 [Rhododendron simsii]